jgi:hypothetical protein
MIQNRLEFQDGIVRVPDFMRYKLTWKSLKLVEETGVPGENQYFRRDHLSLFEMTQETNQ